MLLPKPPPVDLQKRPIHCRGILHGIVLTQELTSQGEKCDSGPRSWSPLVLPGSPPSGSLWLDRKMELPFEETVTVSITWRQSQLTSIWQSCQKHTLEKRHIFNIRFKRNRISTCEGIKSTSISNSVQRNQLKVDNWLQCVTGTLVLLAKTTGNTLQDARTGEHLWRVQSGQTTSQSLLSEICKVNQYHLRHTNCWQSRHSRITGKIP